MFLNRNNKGLEGEDLAVQYLKNRGFKILERNYTNKLGYRKGEVDIIVREGKEIVFVEVKTRKKQGAFSPPPEFFVDRTKFQKLERIAHEYLYSHKKESEQYRFDVIAIEEILGGVRQVKHIRNAFL